MVWSKDLVSKRILQITAIHCNKHSNRLQHTRSSQLPRFHLQPSSPTTRTAWHRAVDLSQSIRAPRAERPLQPPTCMDIQDTCMDIQHTCIDIQHTCIDIQHTYIDIQDTCIDIQDTCIKRQELSGLPICNKTHVSTYKSLAAYPYGQTTGSLSFKSSKIENNFCHAQDCLLGAYCICILGMCNNVIWSGYICVVHMCGQVVLLATSAGAMHTDC